MEPRAAAAAAAHRRVKRAMGLLRAAAAALAPGVDELDLVAEVHIPAGTSLAPVLEVLELARARGHHGDLDVIVLAAPRDASRRSPTDPSRLEQGHVTAGG